MTNLQTIAMVLALLLGIVVVIKGVAEETTACPRNVPAWSDAGPLRQVTMLVASRRRPLIRPAIPMLGSTGRR